MSMKHYPLKGLKKRTPYRPAHWAWPKDAMCYYLGTIDGGKCDVLAVFLGPNCIGSELADQLEVIAAPINEGEGNAEMLARMRSGILDMVKDERYEVAAICHELEQLIQLQ